MRRYTSSSAGDNRVPCFYAEEDYRFYLHWLQLNAEHHGCAIHAYVLMTNHVYLMLTPKERDSASKLMQSLGRRYVHNRGQEECKRKAVRSASVGCLAAVVEDLRRCR
jgi:REP element-mobilizing transposase RayT